MALVIDRPSPEPLLVLPASARAKRSKARSANSVREALALVAHGELELVSGHRGGETDSSGAVPQRVLDQVAERRLDPGRVEDPADAGAGLDGDPAVPRLDPAGRSAPVSARAAPGPRRAPARAGAGRSPSGPVRGGRRRGAAGGRPRRSAERIAARLSSLVRSGRIPSSSSPRRIASGVRSSWPASATNDRSRSIELSIRASISFRVLPSRAISSSDAGSGQPLAAALERDPPCPSGASRRPA